MPRSPSPAPAPARPRPVSISALDDARCALPVVVVCGATGRLGRAIAENLAAMAQCAVVVGGRDRVRTEAVARELAAPPPAAGKTAARATGRRLPPRAVVVDVARDGVHEVAERFRALGVCMIVNAVGPFHEQECLLLKVAIAMGGVHYLDVADDINGFAKRAKELHHEAAQAGARCLITCGVFPGLANLIAAEMVEQGKGAHSIRLDYIMSGSGGFGSSVILSSMNGSVTPSIVFVNHEPRACAPFTGRRLVNFGPILGKRAVYHLARPECVSIHQVTRAANVRAMFGTSPDFFNRIMFLTGTLLKFMPREWKAGFAEYALRSVKPFDWLLGRWFAMRVAVMGMDGILRVHRETHRDGYSATGDSVARQVLSVIRDESIQPGVWFPEEVICGLSRTEIIQSAMAMSESCDFTSMYGTVEDMDDLSFDEKPLSPMVSWKPVLMSSVIVVFLYWVWECSLPICVLSFASVSFLYNFA